MKGPYVFRLHNINHKKLIESHYLKSDTKDIDSQNDPHIDEQTTELKMDTIDKSNFFYDQSKNRITNYLTMIDCENQKYVPMETNIPCWWCGYNIITNPIGLPTKYFYEENTDFQSFLEQRNLSKDTKFFFETEGVFCSFTCCKAYILDKPFNSSYKKSCNLLSLMYFITYGKWVNIPTAPSWKLLEKWGGPIDINDYHTSIGNFVYRLTPNIKRPFMFTTHTYIEELKVK